MHLQDLVKINIELKVYIGQVMQPYNDKVVDVIQVPSNSEARRRYLNALATDYAKNIKLVSIFDTDFTVIVLFDPISNAVNPDHNTFRWAPYEVFLHRNNLNYTKG